MSDDLIFSAAKQAGDRQCSGIMSIADWTEDVMRMPSMREACAHGDEEAAHKSLLSLVQQAESVHMLTRPLLVMLKACIGNRLWLRELRVNCFAAEKMDQVERLVRPRENQQMEMT